MWEVKARRKGLSPKGSKPGWLCCCPGGPGAAEAPQAFSGLHPLGAGSRLAAGCAGGLGGGDTTKSCGSQQVGRLRSLRVLEPRCRDRWLVEQGPESVL